MRIRKLIWILAGCCLLSGCQSGNENLSEKNVSDTEVTEESSESRKEIEQDFPQRIQEDVGENVHIDAECVYPENFQEGKGLKAVQSGSTLWEQREQIVDKFAKGNPVLDVEETSYDDFQSESYTLTETTGISITSENVLNYFSDQATYILNTIMEDDRFDTYNGNEFQTTTKWIVCNTSLAIIYYDTLRNRWGITKKEQKKTSLFLFQEETLSPHFLQ